MKVAALAFVLLATSAAFAADVLLPVEVVADRFFLKARRAGGATVRFFTDSGGGMCFVYADGAKTLHQQKLTLGGEHMTTTPWASFTAPGLPPLGTAPLFIEPRGDEDPSDSYGFLGQPFFAGRAWTWDYPARTLRLWEDGLPASHGKTEGIAVHFPARGERKIPPQMFGRIEIEIDGEKLPVLFDTGATVVVTDEARAALHDGAPAERATSFITMRTLKRWRQRHPAWRVIEHGQFIGTGFVPLIEVPQVTVAGFSVGPVWFTGRENGNFDDFMSSMMDAHVEGALGGSALRYFRVSMDYPKQRAVFERP